MNAFSLICTTFACFVGIGIAFFFAWALCRVASIADEAARRAGVK